MNTFKLYMSALTSRVERNIWNYLPDRFSLVFDGQTTLGTRYMAVFAIFLHQNAHGYRSTYLSLSPLADETTYNTEDNITFQQFVLEMFWNDRRNVFSLVGNKCNVNRSISTKHWIPLLEYDSHRFQLAVKDIVKKEKVVIANVKQLMTRLCAPLMSAELRHETILRSRLQSGTR